MRVKNERVVKKYSRTRQYFIENNCDNNVEITFF